MRQNAQKPLACDLGAFIGILTYLLYAIFHELGNGFLVDAFGIGLKIHHELGSGADAVLIGPLGVGVDQAEDCVVHVTVFVVVLLGLGYYQKKVFFPIDNQGLGVGFYIIL